MVNADSRRRTENNHTATHLLHAALRQVLGDHVQQRGSLVNDKLLRFDFSHFAKMTEEEIRQVEHIVNRKIRENIPLEELRQVPIDEAKAMGATALFGEKYGDNVRVIIFDRGYSVELCGGTHIKATGSIGYFKIVSESSTAAGIRRIEAITADAAEAYVNEQEQLLDELKALLKNPVDLKKSVDALLSEKNQLQKQLEAMQQKEALVLRDQLIKQAFAAKEAQVIVGQVQLPNADMLKKLAYDIKHKVDHLFLVIAADIDGKPQIAVMIDDTLTKAYDLHAGNIVRELARNIQGGGGGQPFFATAGGKNVQGLPAVVQQAQQIAGQVFR